MIANLSLGNTPHIEGFLAAGFIPFVAVRPRITCNSDQCWKYNGQTFAAGQRGKFAIVTAGFNVQHAIDEVILHYEPGLRGTTAGFRKGMLAFNTLSSVGYALASWLGLEDPRGDIASAAEMSGISHNVIAGFLTVAPQRSCPNQRIFQGASDVRLLRSRYANRITGPGYAPKRGPLCALI